LSLRDAQELQFKKSNDAIRNERARATDSLREATLPRRAAEQDTHIANAIAVRTSPSADPADVARDIRAWKPYDVLTTAEQEHLLTSIVIDKVSRQIRLFTVILLLVSTVIVALIVYTMTLDKVRDIATLKLIGAPQSLISRLILQHAVALGAMAFVVGAGLINVVYDRFPRRVVLLRGDELLVLGILMVMCVVASLVGIRRAASIEPLQALGG
jgi:putative ABC transport system permease protein